MEHKIQTCGKYNAYDFAKDSAIIFSLGTGSHNAKLRGTAKFQGVR